MGNHIKRVISQASLLCGVDDLTCINPTQLGALADQYCQCDEADTTSLPGAGSALQLALMGNGDPLNPHLNFRRK